MNIFFASVKLSALSLCCMGMETGLESTEDMSSLDPLARRLADGDPGAPRELVKRHHAELHRYTRALMHDAAAADDAVQEAFGRAFAALGKYPKERIETLTLRPWLYRITLNVIRNAWRDSRREVPVAQTPEGRDERLGAVSSLPSGVDREAWMDTLEALGRLSERQRVAVTLRYLQDLPYAGISEATGWPENTCKTLVRRGIARLGALLSDRSKVDGGR